MNPLGAQKALLVSVYIVLALATGIRVESLESDGRSGAQHSNNWAVLVCTSRYWFNYRHVANTLSIYHTVKRFAFVPLIPPPLFRALYCQVVALLSWLSAIHSDLVGHATKHSTRGPTILCGRPLQAGHSGQPHHPDAG